MSSLLEILHAPGAIRTLFQPILRIGASEWTLHAYEGLTRGPHGTTLESVAALFAEARRLGREAEVDRLCVSNALLDWSRAGSTAALALNVHVATLEHDAEFPDLLAKGAASCGVPAERVVLELVGHASLRSGTRAAEALSRLHQLGIAIAIDDLGFGAAGLTNFQSILDSGADYLKTHRSLVHDCHRDPHRLSVLRGLVQLADSLGARVVAEGVEQPAELRAIQELGIELAQGFLLAPPHAAASLTPPRWREA